MEKGWVKLWRQLKENPLMRRPAYRSVWIEILLEACHSGDLIADFGGEKITLKPGQFTTGAYQIERGTGVPRGTVERIISRFKSEEMIEVRTDRQCSLITVKNWGKYQKSEERNEERMRNDRGTSEERNPEKRGLRKNGTKNVIMKEEPPVASATPNAGVQEVLKEFYKINPAIQFGSPPQRKAATELLSRLGVEKLLPVIASLAASNLDRYAPKIYTPVELRNKWSALVDFWKRKEQDKPKPKTVDITNR